MPYFVRAQSVKPQLQGFAPDENCEMNKVAVNNLLTSFIDRQTQHFAEICDTWGGGVKGVLGNHRNFWLHANLVSFGHP